MKRPILFCICVMCAAPHYAYGYLDPSTGSMVLQVAIGGFVTALAAVRMYWKKIRFLFSRRAMEPDSELDRSHVKNG